MNAIKLARKYPQFGQDGIFALQDTFNKCDDDGNGYLDEARAIKAAQDLERKPYDEVRAALKTVELDSSRRVELDDFVDVCVSFPLMRGGARRSFVPASRAILNLAYRHDELATGTEELRNSSPCRTNANPLSS